MSTQRRQTAIILLVILILVLVIWLVYYFFIRSPGVMPTRAGLLLLPRGEYQVRRGYQG